MKRLFFLLFTCMISIPVASFAQKKSLEMDHENFFRIGVKAGLNINKVKGKSFSDAFSYNYQLGGFLQFNLTNRIGIQPEISFVQSSAEVTDDGTVIYDDIFGGGSQAKAKLSSLEIPLLLNVNIGNSKRVKFQIGPAFNTVLQEKFRNLDLQQDIYKKTEWSAITGIWFQLPFINAGARYKLGLTNVNGIDNREDWKNQAFQLFVGFTF
ncbi:MAG TPA: porin family protein [Ferruginibacter sp.]|nr:porin family protein [Ferruginibacter sp.]